ncbi:TauD/TfdA family dioxygenase [Marinobacterium marinum]|uniref:TauD/TfdA family dioxygenase n=1 Tax=Marinobacterium marinum TaxID=2756129 RepID=A0A7W1WW63_9GAMM|nr:TauD/TfdA family dioxygenase [Marinobacterium marinum]MBA4501354.1 TauD/TfdA family dioxygenase [Marinobacterium marinum]
MIDYYSQAIDGRVAWMGQDLDSDSGWIYSLSADEQAVLHQALEHVQSKGFKAPDFEQSDFPIEPIRPSIDRILNELEEGRGFILIRGLDADRYSEEELQSLYYGLGLYMGRSVKQNARGDLLGMVTNVGDLDDKNTRVYETNAYLPYHTDLSDVVGLLSIQRAKNGGLSSLVSAATIYNTILDEAPEYLEVLYQPFYFAHLGEEKPTPSPIFSYHRGKLSCRYLRQYIELGHDIAGVPLTPEQVSAMDLFDDIMHRSAIKLDMMLEPGDIQFANNYMVLHSRTGFEDHDEPARRRKLVRLWLKMPNARELAPSFPGRNGFSD